MTVDVKKMTKRPLPQIFNPLGNVFQESNRFRSAPLPRPQELISFLQDRDSLFLALR